MLVRDFEALKNLSFLHHDGINHKNYVFSAGSPVATVENIRVPKSWCWSFKFPVGSNKLAESLHAGSDIRRRCVFSAGSFLPAADHKSDIRAAHILHRFQQVQMYLPGNDPGYIKRQHLHKCTNAAPGGASYCLDSLDSRSSAIMFMIS